MTRLERFFKRPETPTDIRSDHEIVIFASDTGRLKVVNHAHEEHTFAYLDEAGGGDGIAWLDTDGPVEIPGGINFDNHEEGRYLWLETHDPDGVPDSGGTLGIYLHDSTVPSGSYGTEILLQCEHGPISLYSSTLVFGPNIMTVESDAFSYNGGGFSIGIASGNSTDPPGEFTIGQSDPGTWLLEVKAATGHGTNDGYLQFWSQGFPSVPVLKVTQDGHYHILTGAAWVADL